MVYGTGAISIVVACCGYFFRPISIDKKHIRKARTKRCPCRGSHDACGVNWLQTPWRPSEALPFCFWEVTCCSLLWPINTEQFSLHFTTGHSNSETTLKLDLSQNVLWFYIIWTFNDYSCGLSWSWKVMRVSSIQIQTYAMHSLPAAPAIARYKSLQKIAKAWCRVKDFSASLVNTKVHRKLKYWKTVDSLLFNFSPNILHSRSAGQTATHHWCNPKLLDLVRTQVMSLVVWESEHVLCFCGVLKCQLTCTLKSQTSPFRWIETHDWQVNFNFSNEFVIAFGKMWKHHATQFWRSFADFFYSAGAGFVAVVANNPFQIQQYTLANISVILAQL